MSSSKHTSQQNAMHAGDTVALHAMSKDVVAMQDHGSPYHTDRPYHILHGTSPFWKFTRRMPTDRKHLSTDPKLPEPLSTGNTSNYRQMHWPIDSQTRPIDRHCSKPEFVYWMPTSVDSHLLAKPRAFSVKTRTLATLIWRFGASSGDLHRLEGTLDIEEASPTPVCDLHQQKDQICEELGGKLAAIKILSWRQHRVPLTLVGSNPFAAKFFRFYRMGRVEELLVAEELWNDHKKLFFFPLSSAATCTNRPLEVD
ncbi:hypothetical protein Taro_042789 [Colocasia esculenta]|uniref:Uncharacterized protein n=1 Tax=Colocasia esculenta TaxID=4460 RepID=A0A843WQH1_COLES|nr:hypothetical protein [Colocasia esculenta]